MAGAAPSLGLGIGGDLVAELAEAHGTPLFVYDAAVIQQRVSDLKAHFPVVRYAQKANANLAVLSLMRQAGVVVDAVSAGEVYRAARAGFLDNVDDDEAEPVVFTADVFDDDSIRLINEHGVGRICIGSADMLEEVSAHCPAAKVTVRVNPGFGHGHSQKVNTGGPSSKHGVWHEDLPAVVARAADLGITLDGLHMHIGSGSDFDHLSAVCQAMVDCARVVGPALTTISAGGGIPIPYHHSTEDRIDLGKYYEAWAAAAETIAADVGHPVSLEVEPGRYLVAESGVLIARVKAVKRMGENHFVVVDAGFDNLIRPAFYGAFHDMHVIRAGINDYHPDAAAYDESIDPYPTEGEEPPTDRTVVGGPLCESCDVFTQKDGGVIDPRQLRRARVGDLVVIHDVGAYGAAMSSNYNTRRLAAEVMLLPSSVAGGEAATPVLIRERQPFEAIVAFDRVPEALASGSGTAGGS